MANFKKQLQHFEITAEDRARLTSDEIEQLEEAVRQMRELEFEPEGNITPGKFDATDMVPVGEVGPHRWTKRADEKPSTEGDVVVDSNLTPDDASKKAD